MGATLLVVDSAGSFSLVRPYSAQDAASSEGDASEAAPIKKRWMYDVLDELFLPAAAPAAASVRVGASQAGPSFRRARVAVGNGTENSTWYRQHKEVQAYYQGMSSNRLTGAGSGETQNRKPLKLDNMRYFCRLYVKVE